MLPWILRWMDIIFPLSCSICKKQGSVVCDSCLEKIAIQSHYHSIGECEAISFFQYHSHDLIGKIMKRAKYYHQKQIFKILTQHIIPSIPKSMQDKCYTLVPVPMHWMRKNFRGYNQSEIIGNTLCEYMKNWSMNPCIKRKRNTPQQAKLKKAERIINLENAFELLSKNAPPITTPLLLIDDIITTGSTIKEMIMVLKKAGYQKISILTLGSAK